MSESSIQDLARLTYAQKVYTKLLYGIQKHDAIVIMYTIAISYTIKKTTIHRMHDVRPHKQSQFSYPVEVARQWQVC